MKRDNGGPAFPHLDWYETESGPIAITHAEAGGLSLRDYFAAHALAGVILHPNATDGSPRRDAEVAYLIADAMLAEREKGGV